MAKKIQPDLPRVNTFERVQIPEVFQYCDKCKTETVHKKITTGKKLVLNCITCNKHVK